MMIAGKYIPEIIALHDEAKDLFNLERMDLDPAFRKWRGHVTTLINLINDNGGKVKCDIEAREFGVFDSVPFNAKMESYNQDLQDTVNELNYIIKFHEKYGVPEENEKESSSGISELDNNDKISFVERVQKNAGLFYFFSVVGAFWLGIGVYNQYLSYTKHEVVRLSDYMKVKEVDDKYISKEEHKKIILDKQKKIVKLEEQITQYITAKNNNNSKIISESKNKELDELIEKYIEQYSGINVYKLCGDDPEYNSKAKAGQALLSLIETKAIEYNRTEVLEKFIARQHSQTGGFTTKCKS